VESSEKDLYAKLDGILLSIRRYCHPDAPKEYVVISRDAIPCGDYSYPKVSELCKALELGVKVVTKLIVKGREVELVADPILDGRVAVFVRREPRGDLLTFSEVHEILQSLEGILGVRVTWGRPFPRGSC